MSPDVVLAPVEPGDAGERTAALSPVDDAAERAGEEQVVDERSADSRADEAQAAAMLHHGNIVPVYGVGCDRGVHYYAMQLIEGLSLAAVIAGGAI